MLGYSTPIAGSSTLVIVDDARSAEALLGWALHEALRSRSGVEVLYLPAFPHGEGSTVDLEALEQGRKELTETLDRIGAGARVSLEVGTAEESTIEGIRARALSDSHRLVMVGSAEANTLVSLVFGSDAYRADAGRQLTLTVVPRSACSTPLPSSTRSSLTVGFHGSDPAADALRWAVAEAERRDGVVRAVMAWWEGEYGAVGGPVAIIGGPSSLAGRSANRLAVELLSQCGVVSDRVSVITRRGVPGRILSEQAAGSDLLAVSAGQSLVFGHRSLGAITLSCLTQSPVPVVIVPGNTFVDSAERELDAEAVPA